jgi:chromosome segregation ATPase
MQDANSDKVFCCYVASRIYLLLITRRYCDLVVDVTSLGDPVGRAETETALSRLLDVQVDLGDFQQRVDYPKQLIQSSADSRMMLDELIERSLVEVAASDDERQFARGLRDATWDAYARFMAYTSGARELLEHDAQRIEELAGAVASTQQRVQELEGKVAGYEREVAMLRHAAEGRRLQAEAVEAGLRDSRREVADLQDQLAVVRGRAK